MTKIVPFPVARQVPYIRECARILMIRQGLAAERFWKLECRRLEARLTVQRCEPEAIRREIEAFGRAVQHEMQRGCEAAPIGGDAT